MLRLKASQFTKRVASLKDLGLNEAPQVFLLWSDKSERNFMFEVDKKTKKSVTYKPMDTISAIANARVEITL